MGNKDGGMGFGPVLIAGAVIGLALGLLFAPRPGKETREMLKKRMCEMADKMQACCARTGWCGQEEPSPKQAGSQEPAGTA